MYNLMCTPGVLGVFCWSLGGARAVSSPGWPGVHDEVVYDDGFGWVGVMLFLARGGMFAEEAGSTLAKLQSTEKIPGRGVILGWCVSVINPSIK